MSLRLRLVLAFGYVLLLVIIVLELPLALNLASRVDAEVKAEASGQARVVAASAAERLDRRRELERLVASSAESLGARVILVDRRGRLLADSAGRGLRAVSYATRPEIARALAGDTVQGRRHSASLDEGLLFTSVPVLRGGRAVGAARVTQSVAAVNDEVRRDVLALVAVGLGALAIGLGVAWLIAGSLAQPLRSLAAAARRVARGELSARAVPSGASEQRETAEAFNDMTERLGRALAAQSEFAGNASHQLRTPLTGLRLRLEAASLKADDEDLRRELLAAEHEAARMATIVNDLLALARDGERAQVDAHASLSAVAEAAAERWTEVAERKGARISLQGTREVHVRASEADLAVICDNLVENALIHSPDGGTVALEWGTDAKHGYIAVLDEGPGIDPLEAERVFERFYRGNSAVREHGSGLGLSVVDALAKRWEGEALIENRREGGARAVVRLMNVGANRAGTAGRSEAAG